MPIITPIANNPLTLWAQVKIAMLSHTNNQEQKLKIGTKPQFLRLCNFQSKCIGAHICAICLRPTQLLQDRATVRIWRQPADSIRQKTTKRDTCQQVRYTKLSINELLRLLVTFSRSKSESLGLLIKIKIWLWPTWLAQDRATVRIWRQLADSICQKKTIATPVSENLTPISPVMNCFTCQWSY